MTTQVDQYTTVRDLVGRHPQTRRVFETFEIDYCCGGGKSLSEAATEHDLRLPVLLGALSEAVEAKPASTEASERDWYAAPLGELVDHILQTHHRYVKSALPRLRLLVPKVLSAHGAQHGEVLRQVQVLFQALDDEISSHLMKEEQMLFPYIVALEESLRAGAPKPPAPFGSIENPVRQMENEHERAGDVLGRLRAVTGDYALPDDACPTFDSMYEELQRFTADLHQHIHLENNILFPRAIELERT